MIILGLDLSLTETGFCAYDLATGQILESGVIKTDKKKFKDGDELDRLLHICSEIIDLTGKHDIEFAVLEGFSFGSRGQALFQIAGLSYLVRYHLKCVDIDYSLVPPTALKKWVTKKGNAPKEVMMLHAYKRWKKSFDNNNMCDAFCLCKYHELS